MIIGFFYTFFLLIVNHLIFLLLIINPLTFFMFFLIIVLLILPLDIDCLSVSVNSLLCCSRLSFLHFIAASVVILYKSKLGCYLSIFSLWSATNNIKADFGLFLSSWLLAFYPFCSFGVFPITFWRTISSS